MAKHSPHILELARRGARHRVEELQQEIATLISQFPDLRSGRRGRKPQIDVSAEPAATIDRPARKRRRRMSAANRKAVAERMRKYWAARRAGKKR